MYLPRFPETWIGDWKKEGHISPNLHSTDLIKCKFCREDQAMRRKKMHLGEKLQSYAVTGFTKPGEMWEWEDGICRNPVRCWGLSIRNWTVLKSTANNWIFRTYISEENNPTQRSLIDEIKVNLKQGIGSNRLLYSGIATGGQCNSFWPLISGHPKHPPARRIVITMRSGEPLPQNANITNRFKLKHMFPNFIVMQFFEQPKIKLPSGESIPDKPNYPKSEEDLEEIWTEISQQYIFMYPGGSGARIEQFLKIPDFTVVRKREQSLILPYWFENKYSGFLPDLQGGWSGPIVSYYKRIDCKKRVYW